jgi:hypothetical protein
LFVALCGVHISSSPTANTAKLNNTTTASSSSSLSSSSATVVGGVVDDDNNNNNNAATDTKATPSNENDDRVRRVQV